MMNEIFLEIANKIKCERPAVGTSWVRSADTLIADKRLTPTAIRVYNALLDMCTKDREVITISLNRLKKLACCCRNSVHNALKILHQYRYIDKKPKLWRTEINTFRVFKILPDKQRNSSAKDAEQFEYIPEIQAKPKKAKKSRKKKPEQPEMKRYGTYHRVKLTDKDYNSLLNDFGKTTVELYIQRADNYCKNKNKSYSNNAEIIRKWIEEDRRCGRSPQHKLLGAHNQMPKEELASYMRLGMQFVDPTEYTMTDEEVSQILDHHNFDIIYQNPDHPLFSYGEADLYNAAKQQREHKDSS